MINFLKFRWIYFLISTVVIVSGLLSILTFGYTYSIDFTGGTNLQYKFSVPVNQKTVSEAVKSSKLNLIDEKITGQEVFLRLKAIDEKKEVAFRSLLEKNIGSKITVLQFDTVGPTLGKETINKTIIASILAIIGILLYMAFAFRGFTFALAAIAALIHDFLVVMGTYSILSHVFGAEFDTLFVTALLTTMSFSVHDTIIIFDKIREYKKTMGIGNMKNYANQALTETLIRSVNNSMTIIFMMLALTLLGGNTIRFFVSALLVGTITGTYSSPFVATPILVWLENRKR